MMRRVLRLLLLLAALGLAGAVRADVHAKFFDQKFGDFKAELATAKAQGKQGILIMFEQEDCPFCHRMKETVLSRPEVQAYFRKHFLIFSVDIKGDTPVTDFAGKESTEKAFAFEHRARATPVFAFFGLDGQPLTRYTGATKDAAEFMQLGRYVVDGAYKTTTFAAYKRAQ